MTDEEIWKRRFLLFTLVRLGGLIIIALGVAAAFGDIVRPGGAKFIGAALIALGTVELALLPVLLKRRWSDEP